MANAERYKEKYHEIAETKVSFRHIKLILLSYDRNLWTSAWWCRTTINIKRNLFFVSYLLTGLCIGNWTIPLLPCLYIKCIHQLRPYTFLNLWYIRQRKHYVCFVSHKNLFLRSVSSIKLKKKCQMGVWCSNGILSFASN